MPKLIVKKNTDVVEEVVLVASKTVYTLGSDPQNDVVLRDKRVSNKHLRIERSNGNFYLEDLKSAFGTKLNGRPLLRRVQIVHGDEIALGDFHVFFDNQSITAEFEGVEDDELEVIDEHYLERKLKRSPTQSPAQSPTPHPTHTAEVATASVSEPAPAKAEENEFYEIEAPEEERKPKEPPAPASQEGPQPIAPSGGPSYHLLAIYGPYLGKKFPLKLGDNRIGRDNTLNDIVIRENEEGALDPSISRRHATVSYRNGRFYVTDKRSKTRTYVNQTKLQPGDEVPLEVGDEIEIVSDQKSTILRLGQGDELDPAPPRKAGIWWVRNQLRAGLALAAVFGFLALSTFGWSCVNRMALNKRPSELKFIEEAWYQQAGRGAAATETIDRWRALAADDLNGDGSVDVVFADRSQRLTAVDGLTKKVIWRAEAFPVLADRPIVLADLNANALPDVLVVGHDSRLRALDGATGVEIWLSPILGSNLSSPVVADLNYDGLRDIALVADHGQIHLGYSYINDVDWKTLSTDLTLNSTPAALDLDGDGAYELVLGTEEGKLLIVDGIQSKIDQVYDFGSEANKVAVNFLTEHQIRYPSAGGDLNGDGALDLVVGATNGHYLSVTGHTLTRVWHQELPVAPGVEANLLAPVVGELNGDGIEDAVLMSNRMLRVVQGSDTPEAGAAELWSHRAESELMTPVTLADFDKDGAQDVIVADRQGTVYVLSGRDGQMLQELPQEANPVISPLLVADLGLDAYLDILFMRQDGTLYKVQTNSRSPEGAVVWGQAYANARNSGRYEFALPESTGFTLMSAASALFFLAIGGLTLRAHRNRMDVFVKNQNA